MSWLLNNPPHPGTFLIDELEELGWSQAQAAAKLGVTRATVSRLANGKSAITAEMALRLEAEIGSTAEQWLRLQAAYDLAQARKSRQQAASASAGA